jgi:ABC-2 type transport system permease protein
VRFRDVAIIWTVIATALNYATPVIYPLQIIENETLKHALMANPLAPLFQQAHLWLIDDPKTESLTTAAGGPLPLIAAAAIYIGVCVAGVWVFNREAPRIAEQL